MRFVWCSLLTFVLTAQLPFAAAESSSSNKRPLAQRPDIVLIMVDDMGFSDIGCYGSNISTPNLDGLAANGLRFSQFYNTGRCCPTRAALMTGLYSHQTGVGHMMNDRGTEGYRGDLNRNCMTIAEVLGQSGYATYMSGKWHLTKTTVAQSEADKYNWPLQRGFERYFGIISGAANYYTPKTLTLDNTPIKEFEEDFYFTDAISDHAADFIREHQNRRPKEPFFCYVAYTAPHWPLHALPQDIAKYRGSFRMGWDELREQRLARQREIGLALDSWDLSERHPGQPAWDSLDSAKQDEMDLLMSIYAAMITTVDRGVGRIVKELSDAGRLENTLIFFLADNGGCAEGGILGNLGIQKSGAALAAVGGVDSNPRLGGCWANVNNTPFRFFKHYVHEGGAASPLIVHWPGGLDKKDRNQFRRQPGHLVDIMATCVDVSGSNYPNRYQGHDILPMEGRSLVPAFDDQPIDRDALYWEHEGHCAIRIGDWKLVSLDKGKEWELFDMSTDRSELNDLSSRQPEHVDRMAAQWTAWAERTNVLPWPQSRQKSAKKKEGKKSKKK